jgi:hypothetical protein
LCGAPVPLIHESPYLLLVSFHSIHL